MANGESITLFLIDGSPNGLIQCTIGNWKYGSCVNHYGLLQLWQEIVNGQ